MATLLSLVVSPSAFCADWSGQPSLEWRADHQSNRTLSATDRGADQASWLSLSAALQRATPNTEWSLRPYLQIQRYLDDTRLNAEDSSLQLMGRWRREYSQLVLNAAISRSSTLTSELAETGIVDVNTRRDQRNVSLSWSFDLSTVSRLETQLGYENIEYPHGRNAGLVGYRYPNGSLAYVRRLSQYTSWNLNASGGRLESPLTATVSRSANLRAGMTRDLSAALNLDVSLGLSETRVENSAGTRVDRSQVWEALLKRSMEFGELDFSLARSIAPNGRGVLAQRDDAGVSWTRVLAPRFSMALSARATRNADRGSGASSNSDYRYFSAETAFNCSLSQNWSLGLRLGGSDADRAAAGADAHGWYTALAVNWAPRSRPIQRWLPY